MQLLSCRQVQVMTAAPVYRLQVLKAVLDLLRTYGQGYIQVYNHTLL